MISAILLTVLVILLFSMVFSLLWKEEKRNKKVNLYLSVAFNENYTVDKIIHTGSFKKTIVRLYVGNTYRELHIESDKGIVAENILLQPQIR